MTTKLGAVRALDELYVGSAALPVESRKQLAAVAVTTLFGFLKKEGEVKAAQYFMGGIFDLCIL